MSYFMFFIFSYPFMSLTGKALQAIYGKFIAAVDYWKHLEAKPQNETQKKKNPFQVHRLTRNDRKR